MARAFPGAMVILALLAGGAPAFAQPIFADGFESGFAAEWSSVSGPIVPEGVCAAPIAPVDVSDATMVGNGTPGSCTEGALDVALATHGGAIRSPLSFIVRVSNLSLIVRTGPAVPRDASASLQAAWSARLLRALKALPKMRKWSSSTS